jgi:hypothetical protein
MSGLQADTRRRRRLYHDNTGVKFRVPALISRSGAHLRRLDAGYAVALVQGFARDSGALAQATSALNATGLGSQAGVKDFGTLNFMKTTKTK